MNCGRPIAIAFLSLALAGFASFCSAQSSPSPTPAPAAANGSVPASATAPTAPAPVQVTSHGDQLEVKVPDQAPLSTVMSSLCQQQKLKCTGTETLTTYHGPAMSVEGTLRQVIAKLVEGTDINYEFSRSAEGGATAIAFLGHAPKGTAPVPTAEQPAPAPVTRPIHSRPFPGNVPPGAGAPPAPPPGPQSQLIQQDAMPNPEALPATAISEDAKSQHAAGFLDTGSGHPSAGFLPFPDGQGNLIPLTNTTPTVLPFPDQFGNPIPIKPSPGGSPFPMNPSKPNTGSSTQQ
jgi:hypothetical protein